MRLPLSLLLAVAALLPGQDAGLVLSTSVSYSTLAASTPLAAERKAEIDGLRAQAMKASAAGSYAEALRHLHHGMALMRGLEWTPAVELATALTPKVNHAVWEPGDAIQLQLSPLFQPEGTFSSPIEATIRLQTVPPGTTTILKQCTLGGQDRQTTFEVPKIAAGKYQLEVVLAPVPRPKTLGVIVAPGMRKRAGKLQERVGRLNAKEDSGFWTAQYVMSMFQLADRSEINVGNIDLDRELTWGEQVVDALASKRDPFAGRVGDMRRAYRSAVDKTLQPYRLFVPSSYKAGTAFPLLVALHGMGGDENTLLDRYNSRALQDLAEKNGYLVAAPKGREPASMYRGPAEQDVMDVLTEVRAGYTIDPGRIYLMGHSMGAYGTWSIAMNYPHVFAALAPVAGGGNPASMQKIRHIPQLVVHGDNDKTVPVRASGVMVEAARALGVEVEYIEVKDGGHVDVFVPAIPKMFDWFNAHRKPATAAAGKP